jgi:hypothetical protein
VARCPRTVLAALSVLLVSACGSSDSGGPLDNGEAAKPADQILKDSVAALRGAQSVHLVGELSTGSDVLGLDLRFTRAGNTQGTVTLGSVHADIVISGGRTYLRGRELFARFGNAQTAQAIGDHWVVLSAQSSPEGDIVQALSDFIDFNKLADVFASPTGGAVTKGGISTVDGRSVVALRDSDGILYVATTGRPYPVEVKPDAGSKPLHFMSWDAGVDVKAPSDALDLTSVTGGGSPEASPTP